MESREDEIKRLKAKIDKREVVRDGLTVDREAYAIELTKELAIDKQRLLLLEQQGSANTQGKAKTIFVIIPPVEKDEEAVVVEQIMTDDKAISRLENKLRGALSLNGKMVDKLDDVVDGAVYDLVGGLYTATKTSATRAQVDSKLVEIECSMAVRDAMYPKKTAHMHLNYKLKDEGGKDKAEYDSIIHGNEKDLMAYVLETAYSPLPEKADKLLAKIELLKESARSPLSHFHETTTFIPVLGGRLWSKETTDKCKANNIWRVKPSGTSYQLRRTLSTSAVKVMTFLLK